MREAAPPPVGNPACKWVDASVAFTLHLNPNLMPRLGIEAWTAFKQVPHRGLEIGGILLGRGEVEGNSVHLWIDGYRTVDSEHRLGPSYLLSENDYGRLREDVESCGIEAVGLFRTHTRSQELALEASDSETLARCFDGGAALFLMLGPVPGKAAFFARVQGELRCVHECPLTSSLSAMLTLRQERPPAQTGAHPEAEHRIAKAVAVSPPVPYSHGAVAVPERSIPPAPPPLPDSRSPRPATAKPTWVIAAALSLLAFAVIADSVSRALQHDLPGPSFLRLTVQPAGSSLRLSWDPSAPALQGAVRAVLHVDDGDEQNERTLSAAELKRGLASYDPHSGSVTFRLDVYPAQPRSFGVVQVLDYSPVIPARAARRIAADDPLTEDDPAPDDAAPNDAQVASHAAVIASASVTAGQEKPDLRGISVAPLNPVLRTRFHLREGDSGVVVTAVRPSSAAFDAVLQAGDIIQEVNRRPITGVADLEQAMRNAASSAVLLSVKRDGVLSFHAVP